MKKQNHLPSARSVQFKRAGARLLSDVSSVPSRLNRHVIQPLQSGTGRGLRAAQRAMRPVQACTVGSLAAFVAAVFALDERNPHTA